MTQANTQRRIRDCAIVKIGAVSLWTGERPWR